MSAPGYATACRLLARVSSIDTGRAWRVRLVCTCGPDSLTVAEWDVPTRTAARRAVRDARARHEWGRL